MSSHRHPGARARAVRIPRALLAAGLLLGASLSGMASEPRVGVYYYPGWRNNVLGNIAPRPWQSIQPFPARKPLLGWYDDGKVGIVDQQLAWMADSGIRFIVLDWYWNRDLGVLQGQTLDAYLKSPNRARVPFALLWANHTEAPRDRADFNAMVAHWIECFRRPEYLRLDGRPVIFIFSVALLEQHAQAFGSSAQALLDAARAAARRAGAGELFIVGGTGAGDPTALRAAQGTATGYDAFSAYNYQGPGIRAYADGHTESHSFDELAQAYREQWQWMLAMPGVSFVLPMTAGWDRRPWGGSEDSLHDRSEPTATEFAQHLRSARDVLEHHEAQTHGLGVLCCWNEFGEGSYVEPTQERGFAFLDAVRSVFGTARQGPAS